jgi:hypothetical protein
VVERDSTVGIHKAIVADFHETGGQDMLEEAADELHDIESESSGSLAVGFAVANDHGAVVGTDDAGIGDGDLEDVGGEIFESGFTGAHRLGVDGPVCLPDFGWDLIEEFCLFDQITNLALKIFDRAWTGRKKSIRDGVRIDRRSGRINCRAAAYLNPPLEPTASVRGE